MLPLINAQQSSINPYNSAETADKAIDGLRSSGSCTAGNGERWWSVKLHNAATISTIQLYINEYVFKNYLGKLKLETRLSGSGVWKTCVNEHTVTKPINPHVINCDKVTVAKELKITMSGGSYLCFEEVKVLGTKSSNGKSSISCVLQSRNNNLRKVSKGGRCSRLRDGFSRFWAIHDFQLS